MNTSNDNAAYITQTTTSDGIVVQTRTLDVSDVEVLVDWAAAEGWNPGLDDAAVFHRIDETGYIGGFIDNRLVAGISVIDAGEDFAFLGLYLCDPDFRGRGIGYATWQAGIAHAKNRCIGLDGVPAQQDNYRRSGFVFAWKNVRYGGTLALSDVRFRGDGLASYSLQAATFEDLPDILTLDTAIGGVRRERYLRYWCVNDANRKTLLLRDASSGTLLGLATRRRCREGYKFGPVLAEQPEIACRLLKALGQDLGDAPVFLDVPADNRFSVGIAESLGLAPVFETARMYRGDPPATDIDRLYGVASFELG